MNCYKYLLYEESEQPVIFCCSEICGVSHVAKKVTSRVYQTIRQNLETNVELITPDDYMVSKTVLHSIFSLP